VLAFLLLVMPFANLPNDAFHIVGVEQMLEVVQQLQPGQKRHLVVAIEQSFEMKIVQKMMKMDRWEKLARFHPLKIEQYQELAYKNHLKITHKEPYKFLVDEQHLKLWLEQELAPKLGITPIESNLFVADFLQVYAEELQTLERKDQPKNHLFALYVKEYLLTVQRTPDDMNLSG